jgi:hypothetical protein
MYRDGRYQDVLRGIQRILLLTGEPARRYNRYDLLMLKGDALLKTGASAEAAEAFAAAAKDATVLPPKARRAPVTDRAAAGQPDGKNPDAPEDRAAVARATEVLVRRSRTGGYTPKVPPIPGGGPAGAIPITDRETRAPAFVALLGDELGAIRPKVARAVAGDDLKAIGEVAGAVRDLVPLEIAATGADEQSRGLAEDLSRRATSVLGASVRDIQARVDRIRAYADRMERVVVNGSESYHRVGPLGRDIQDLDEAVRALDRITATARQLAAVLQSDPGPYSAVIEAADKARKGAESLLSATGRRTGRR